MGGLKIINGGLLSTVQDGGRNGYQQFGVPVSGVMDTYAYRLGNYLVGNSNKEAVIEVTLMGFVVEFLEDSIIAITGGDLTPTLNGKPIEMMKTVPVFSGDRLSFQKVKSGCRGYLAIAGGIDVPEVMGSRSTYLPGAFGGHKGRALKKGDELLIGSKNRKLKELMNRSLLEYTMDYSSIVLRIVPGPQEEAFSVESIQNFYSGEYRVTMDCDRMAYRLEGKKIVHKDKAEIISDAIAMGAVQIPGNGQPIVMMADRQTVGGYPKIGNVIAADLPKLAQAKPGDVIRFQKVSIAEAEEALLKMEKELIKITHCSGKHEDFTLKKEYLKFGQRKYFVRINNKEFSVTVELKKDR